MKIVIACGTSGGHLFPGIAVAAELRKIEEDCEIIFVANQRAVDQKILRRENYPYVLVPSCNMPSGLSWRLIPFFIKAFQVFAASFFVLIKVKPDLVVGLGGFTSGPVVISACLLRTPTVIHEQNVFPGRTNMFLAGYVEAIATSFDESEAFFKEKEREKIVCTGNPIRSALKLVDKTEAVKNFGLSAEKFTILVMGGSQGARAINRSVAEGLKRFLPEERSGFQLIHISGEQDCGELIGVYKELGIEARVYSFLYDIDYAFCAADVVISRAGGTSISEISFFGKASILIPYPYARSHQVGNARYMAARDMALLVEEDELLARNIFDMINYFYKDRSRLERFSRPPGSKESALRHFVDLIMNLKLNSDS